jgi:hypothetical protein
VSWGWAVPEALAFVAFPVMVSGSAVFDAVIVDV